MLVENLYNNYKNKYEIDYIYNNIYDIIVHHIDPSICPVMMRKFFLNKSVMGVFIFNTSK
jgi:hypothetical protein